jgi:hypothetical protein
VQGGHAWESQLALNFEMQFMMKACSEVLRLSLAAGHNVAVLMGTILACFSEVCLCDHNSLCVYHPPPYQYLKVWIIL